MAHEYPGMNGRRCRLLGAEVTQHAESWLERSQELIEIEKRQLFFIGGPPRSGTTWLQTILDAHPEVSCKGEGLFMSQLAKPLDALASHHQKAVQAKNQIFTHTGGYPPPPLAGSEHLLGSAVLMSLQQQVGIKQCRAIGEKTPENVFLFPRLKRLFPKARFIGITRDPRDVLSSAWEFFQKENGPREEAKRAFVLAGLPALAQGMRAMLEMRSRWPDAVSLVTYEALTKTPDPMVSELFEALGVSNEGALVRSCIQASSFQSQSGRAPGQEAKGSFHRQGSVGAWSSTLSPELNAIILQELGWAFPLFGWETSSGV